MDAVSKSHPVLTLLARFLAAPPEAGHREEMLRELCRSFSAGGAGVAAVREDVPIVQQRVRLASLPATGTPWETPQLWQQLQTAAAGWIDCVGVGDRFLAAACPRSTRFLWLEAEAARAWTKEEGAALVLAAAAWDLLAPGEALHPGQQRFHHRLQDAAALSGRLAHAFDNILTGILGFAELTLSTVPGDSVTAQYITEVLRAAQQGVQLTQQFHQFSRSSSAASGSASVPLVLAELEKSLRSRLDKGGTLEVDVPAELPLAAIASETLNQVLAHLVDNAVETGPGGRFALSARRAELSAEQCAGLLGNPSPGPFVEIAVSDSGPGLTGEAGQKVFVEPFFSNKPRHRGLGLALVYRIVHANKAGLALQSGPSGGLTARVYLPLALVTSSMPGSRSLAKELQAIREKRQGSA